MRTYTVIDRISDIMSACDRINRNTVSTTKLSADSLEVVGTLPGYMNSIDRRKFTKNTNWDDVRKVESSLKYVADKIRNIEW